MRLDKIFTKRLHAIPSDADTNGHQIALRGGYIHQTGAGVYTFTSLGLKVLRNIENLIRSEMDKLGCQEILMPITSPASLWKESNRYDSVDILLKFKNRAENDFVLNPTHEEIVTDYVRSCLQSYKQLPFSLYQIQTKYRDELRVRAGLIRCREFIMKDAYSFHKDWNDLNDFYNKMLEKYYKIYELLELSDIISVLAPTGDMGGKISHEFQMVSPIGEDTLYICNSCDYKTNKDMFKNDNDEQKCPNCNNTLEKIRGIEVGNIFQLGDKYTKSMNVTYIDENSNKQYPIMGCYGIGINRTFACILEQAKLGKYIWNKLVAPYKIHIISIGNSQKIIDICNKIHDDLSNNNIETIIDITDDRPGSKFSNADLIGAPIRIIVSERNIDNNNENYLEIVEYNKNTEPIKNMIKMKDYHDFIINKFL